MKVRNQRSTRKQICRTELTRSKKIILQDENFGLRLENLELRSLKEENERKVDTMKARSQHDGKFWAFPKTHAKIQRPESKSFLTKNHYSMLNTFKEESSGDKRHSIQPTFQAMLMSMWLTDVTL